MVTNIDPRLDKLLKQAEKYSQFIKNGDQNKNGKRKAKDTIQDENGSK